MGRPTNKMRCYECKKKKLKMLPVYQLAECAGRLWVCWWCYRKHYAKWIKDEDSIWR